VRWAADVLWAKKAKPGEAERWLPLIVHMADTAEVARLMWRDWLPDGTKRRITEGLGFCLSSFSNLEELALKCFVFLAAVHDLGKATPGFQGKLLPSGFDEQLRQTLCDANLPLLMSIHTNKAKHYWASQLLLEKFGFDKKLAGICGGHHGIPPNNKQLRDLKTAFKDHLGWDREVWCQEVQQELLSYALELAGVTKEEAQAWRPDLPTQVLLNGMIIMADWIASNEGFFPHLRLSEWAKPSVRRAKDAWDKIQLPESWMPGTDWMSVDLYKKRFSINQPRPVQTAMKQLMGELSRPGIVILEAPMGEGKTEAALVAAEIMAQKTGRNGIFFALPTQASANGLFLRFCRWIMRLEDGVDHAVKLVHGKADLNELYHQVKKATKEIGRFSLGLEAGEETDEDAIIVHDWFSGRKKGLLAEFAMGTIDQVLMGGLKQKHLALRHLGLANKVVILDECHAYDAYMSQYLYKVLSWLGEYGVPVLVLSATLPGDKRRKLVKAYLNANFDSDPQYDSKPEATSSPGWATTSSYPIITYTDGGKVYQKEIDAKRRLPPVELKTLFDDEQVVLILEDLLSEGGCAGIIVNTVKRAQDFAIALSKRFGDDNVWLHHSRFLAIDRARSEKELHSRLGPDGDRPDFCIVVGTQVFEQSCDLDFDVLFSDICPMDLLIQRIGRLHRHSKNNSNRPRKLKQPYCFVTGMNDSGFDPGTEAVYGKYLLMNTRALLPSQIKLPDDIPRLVQEAYRPEGLFEPPQPQTEYDKAKQNQQQLVADKEQRARSFQIALPYEGFGHLIGWLDMSVQDDPSGKRGEATVRDSDTTLEVLVVQRRGNQFYLLPWLSPQREIPVDVPPDTQLARAMAQCSVQLPQALSVAWMIDRTISELEKISIVQLRAWQESPWLKGDLFLVLDEQLSTELCGYRLVYERRYGLCSEKIEKRDVNAG
jgi:CRISPR-associated endonuclease/helicase Cas3